MALHEKYWAFWELQGDHISGAEIKISEDTTVTWNEEKLFIFKQLAINGNEICLKKREDDGELELDPDDFDIIILGKEDDVYYLQTDDYLETYQEKGIMTFVEEVERNIPKNFRDRSTPIYRVKFNESLDLNIEVPEAIAKYFQPLLFSSKTKNVMFCDLDIEVI